MSWIIFRFSWIGFPISMSTHLWGCLWRCYQWGFDGGGKSCSNIRWYLFLGWGPGLDKSRKHAERQGLSFSFLTAATMWAAASRAFHQDFPILLDLASLTLWVRIIPPSWNCLCQTFCDSKGGIITLLEKTVCRFMLYYFICLWVGHGIPV